ncbi:hypothetical protein CTEN210_13892 [Chaetoceros tenuissimus]|uniref:Translocon-associated protein subunit alpha n=1 Tax=Chaetoceros tenuissimus TaxID=426638 RepID=A0AAD3D3Y6_9STRA|nr:hypothetical protein CTEN210_13892 [Chaetoceros tenuissimus]
MKVCMLLFLSQVLRCDAFAPMTSTSNTITKGCTNTLLFSTPDDGDSAGDEEGLSLASDFAKILAQRNIQLDDADLKELDEDDEEELLDEEDVDDVSLSDDQVYRELDERVLETAGGFVELLGKPGEDDDEEEEAAKPKVYEPPKTVPDSELTAGEVVTLVLEALNNNDVPSNDYGIEILFGYSSPGSAISQAIDVEQMTPAEYAAFLKEEYEYKILFNHDEVIIEKGDYSHDGKKAFYTARLRSPGGNDFTNVNFFLSTDGMEEDDCWLIDSLLIRPEGMRRRRRK